MAESESPFDRRQAVRAWRESTAEGHRAHVAAKALAEEYDRHEAARNVSLDALVKEVADAEGDIVRTRATAILARSMQLSEIEFDGRVTRVEDVDARAREADRRADAAHKKLSAAQAAKIEADAWFEEHPDPIDYDEIMFEKMRAGVDPGSS